MPRGFEVSIVASGHDSGAPRRNSQVDPWRWNSENDVLACFRVFERRYSNEAVLSVLMKRCRHLWREFGGRCCSNVVNDFGITLVFLILLLLLVLLCGQSANEHSERECGRRPTPLQHSHYRPPG
eukprot:5001198-Pyramimonas_sp.AAC.1